jgi:hypothetical protein
MIVEDNAAEVLLAYAARPVSACMRFGGMSICTKGYVLAAIYKAAIYLIDATPGVTIDADALS